MRQEGLRICSRIICRCPHSFEDFISEHDIYRLNLLASSGMLLDCDFNAADDRGSTIPLGSSGSQEGWVELGSGGRLSSDCRSGVRNEEEMVFDGAP